MDAHKPRIGGKELDDYSDQAVILVGKIDANTAFQGAQIVASDGASVEVDFADQQSDLSPYVEITGKVLESGRIEGWAVANLGDSFDFETYEKARAVIRKYPQAFVGED
eukprot:TRINITY_DN1800_c0_g1_i1.p1 TRINITY_DN1800_c0_g1~~TRINITY_DN1800_c0_g1_i1.p1  ORF type:complete len:109 (+),score=24.09 TRINITY_DN1800_c0_g1_i1:111-437(+)